MRPKTVLSIFGAAAALGTGGIGATGAIAQSSSSPASASAQASAFGRHIEGPIVAIDRAARTFTVRDREHGNGLSKVHVTRNTRFDGVRGFGALRRGQRVDVRAVRVNGALSATKVERPRAAEVGDDRGNDGPGHDGGDDRGHDGAGHDAGDDRGHGGHDG
jgi:uncharacterized protein DUF5666